MDIQSLKQDIRFDATQRGMTIHFASTWGLFSPREIDSGSDLLLKYLEIQTNDRILDLGCGYGALGITLAKEVTQGHVLMVDKDFVAVDYARKNISLNKLTNAESLLSNGLAQIPTDKKFTTVISNIPAKVGKEMLAIFLHDIQQHLEPGGQLVVVTINGLRDYMKRMFTETFGNYEKVKQGRDYTISRAVKESTK